MANIPDDRKYTREHEWVLLVGKDKARVGITDHAQRQLGDLVFVELPDVGRQLELGDPFGVVESVKSASDIFTPLTGKVSGRNDLLSDEPETINDDPYMDGWIVELTITKPAELNDLLSPADYKAFLSE
ncbi:glycine cleavage system protein GcvH [Kitasatospora sp. NPDC090091]|uniref:glycine cleavage system protein GcvH n=1 Tax=Kitasatospora sp. NPDC090091 TaxID=3364081 RepID=UPI003821F1A5